MYVNEFIYFTYIFFYIYVCVSSKSYPPPHTPLPLLLLIPSFVLRDHVCNVCKERILYRDETMYALNIYIDVTATVTVYVNVYIGYNSLIKISKKNNAKPT